MRSFCIAGLLFAFAFSVNAQDIAEAKKIPTTYDRSSLAVFFLDLDRATTTKHLKENWRISTSPISTIITITAIDFCLLLTLGHQLHQRHRMCC